MLSSMSAQPSTSLSSLPAEIILEILPYIPFSPTTLQSLCLTCSRLNLLITHHERSLVNSIKATQSPRASLDLFPTLATSTFTGLSTLSSRLSTLTSLHEEWLRITSHSPEINWLKGRWEGIHKTGLLLLYRLQDSGSYNNKVALINGLPATSLACLVFKLISSIKILRIYGPEPIHGGYKSGDVMARSDIELAFEEMLLTHGPEFFITLLKPQDHPKRIEWAVSSLEKEISGMIARQSPTPEGNPKPPTLTSCLRRAFAAKLGCHLSQNVNKMWEILSSTSFDEMDEGKMVLIVKGEEVKGGMKRVF